MDLMAHTGSIQLLLNLLQLRNSHLNHLPQQVTQRSMVSLVQDGFSSCMRRISGIGRVLTTVAAHTQECVEGIRRIMAINVQVFQIVLNLQNLLLSIPGQVERQQPVYLNDALGRYTPFHLEFIRSPKALISVLSDNFKGRRTAWRLIQEGEFIMHDTISKLGINFRLPWDQCFFPGQRVEMSMISNRPPFTDDFCPSCSRTCGAEATNDFPWLVRSQLYNQYWLTEALKSRLSLDLKKDKGP